MRVAAPLLILLAALLGGCASSDTMKAAAAAGEGVKRTYRDDYQSVFDAALRAAKSERLEILEVDKNAGTFLLARTGTASNWGERVGMFVRPVDRSFTQIEIVNRPIFEFIMFSPYWSQVLLGRIDAELLTRDAD